MSAPAMGKTGQLGLVGVEQLPLLDEGSIEHPPSTTVVTFKVYGEPVPQGGMVPFKDRQSGHARTKPSNETKLMKWRYLVGKTAAAEMGSVGCAEPGVPVRVWMTFVRPKPGSTAKKVVRVTTNPDVDKLCRSVLDALHRVVYRDDGQVDELRVRKRFCHEGEPEHVSIVVEIGTKP